MNSKTIIKINGTKQKGREISRRERIVANDELCVFYIKHSVIMRQSIGQFCQ